MSYTVLARKWRPKNFAELVGQAHVMQALANALDQQRLHHAYLFTGTRGVGKTTIARIFAKALNCQEGISSTPCGVCETCRSIDEGRFIDLIEVDAASKTKVDDTREILDNVQFAPTQGRYKVYLIDEVHMLSKSSFNALLKTLEEPPEHVKFLLATTDPHKLPITVLSRCLQFNLMRLTQTQIQTHLANILQQEQIPFEESALALIAKSADGSARDSLSLLDQAIAYSAGQVMFEAVQTMLGLVDQQYTVNLLQALASEDANSVKEVMQQLALMGVDYQALLSQLIESLHAISYLQLFAEHEPNNLMPAELMAEFSQIIPPEKVQLLYQIGLLAKQDMQLAPDVRIGFEMALMRMLAFQPVTSSQSSTVQPTNMTSSSVQANPKESDDAEEMSPAEALASLASARSLVGKKNTEINESSENNSFQSGKEQQFTPRDQEDNFVTESDHHSSPAIESEQRSFNSEAEKANKTDSIPIEVTQNIPEESTLDEAKSSVNDHLSQIKARLKQPFGLTQNFSESVIPAVEDNGSQTQPSEQLTKVEPNIVHNQLSNANDAYTPNNQIDNVASLSESEVVPSHHASGVDQQLEDSPPWHSTFDAEPVDHDRNSIHSASDASESTFQEQPAPQVSQLEQQSSESTVNQDEMPGKFELSGNPLADWQKLIDWLDLKGMAAEFARNCVLVNLDSAALQISLDPEQNFAKSELLIEQIQQAVSSKLGSHVELRLVESSTHLTPIKQELQEKENQLQAAHDSIQQDPIVNNITQMLGMEVIASSIKPIN